MKSHLLKAASSKSGAHSAAIGSDVGSAGSVKVGVLFDSNSDILFKIKAKCLI